MIACPNCGFENAATSRFCRQCGATLAGPEGAAKAAATPVPAAAAPAASATPTRTTEAPTAAQAGLPDAELQARLIEELAADEATPPAVEESTTPTEPLVLPPEGTESDGALQPGAHVGPYEIVELRDEHDGQRTYLARAPADVCAQCGTPAAEADARFCEECGAELVPRDVLLVERSPDEQQPATGPARLTELPDDPLRSLLPPVTNFTSGEWQYLVTEAEVPGFQSLAELLASQGEAPQQPAALDEADALPIALQLAQLLQFLHRNGTALGNLSLAQLLIGPQRRLRLREASDLQPLTDATRQADLQQLAQTLEDLTRIPRLTRKLAPDALDGQTEQPRALEEVLALGRAGNLPDADSWVNALEGVMASRRAIRALTTRLGADTDVGVQRELNEDAFMTQELRIALAGTYVNAGIYVVADGMGGHAAGEVASTLAVQGVANSIAEQLAELAASTDSVDDARLQELVVTAIEQANLAVVEEARRRGNDMGTTITLALVVGDRCIIGNVGDSRTYLFRDGQLQRISKDHSLVMRLVEIGQITEEEIYTHPHRSAILRSLGEKAQVETDTFPLRLLPGDALFLCSDGQWEMVRNPRISEVIATVDDPQEACELLVKEANANGGEDNIAAVLVRFDE